MSNILNRTMTYDEFCEIFSSAWLLAEETTGVTPPANFRRQLAQYIEDGVEGKPNKYSMHNLLGGKQ